jgi:asparagine synthase (glutamine-hydrolysing)
MSAIAGAYSRGGAPIDRAALTVMSGHLRHMGPDGESWLAADRAVLGHRAFHTCDAAVHDAETLRTATCLLTWDGRLDNAAELQALCDGAAPGNTEAATVLAVYSQFGIDGFRRLVGEFSFALWDIVHRRLVLCCDPLGRRLLYYHVAPQFLHWASAARALQQALRLGSEPNEEFIADFLMSNRSPHGPWKGTMLLPPGHRLVASGTDVSVEPYWRPDPRRSIVYRTDVEYEEHFRELFASAVRCRMRSNRPVFCELSGGIDSSSVACVAAGEAGRRRGLLRPQTVSYIFEQSSTSDESRYITDVERFIGEPGLHIGEDECPLLDALPDGFVPDHPTGQLLFLQRQNRVAREMHARGARVLLTGLGGDELFYSEPPPALPLADLLRQGRLIALARASRRWARHSRRSVARTLWRGALAPFWPRLHFRITYRTKGVTPYVAPAFAQRLHLRERRFGMTDDVGFRLPTASQQYTYIRCKMRPPVLEACNSERYIEARHPYLDQRLMEFALAIPADQKIRPGEERSVVRRALRGVMPPSVCARRTKGGPDEAIYRAIGRGTFIEALFRDPLTAAYGFVDPHQLHDTLLRARHGMATAGAAMLVKIIALEMWLAATHGRHILTGASRDPAAPAGRRHAGEQLHAEGR